MENTLDGAARESEGEKSAEQNIDSGPFTFKLVMLWLAVTIPLLWGAIKALQEPGNLLP